MLLAQRTTAVALTCALSLGALACHRGEKTAAGDDQKSNTASSASIPKVQANKTPCDWISRAAAEKALGETLTADPVRVRSAENAVPQADGDGCLYQLKSTSAFSEGKVAIEVTPDDPGIMQSAFTSAPMIDSVFKGKESHGDSVVNGRWDYESALPGGVSMLRAGRMVIQVFAYGKSEQGKSLANAIFDSIADLPFTNDPADPSAASEDPDPCALITRVEAEKELGPLTMAPFRSRENSAIAHGNGSSCVYYTGKHRALVVTPTYTGGGMKYKMMAGVGGMVSTVLGGAKAPDTLDGPWDQISTGATGALTMLKGDKMIEMQYKSSPADYGHAVNLARAAASRL
ncbi:MAG TPA: hypothetical protein VGJ12_01245 [Gemmatimonadaceae bacterium]|jgi:hypothetical protein